MRRATKPRRPNALVCISTCAAAFDHLCRAILRVPKLYIISSNIIGGTDAPAGSIDQGQLFFDGCFYLPVASPLLPDLLETLHIVGDAANLCLLVVGFHTLPTTVLTPTPFLQA